MDKLDLYGVRVPANVAAEQALLGSMLLDPSCIPEVLAKLNAIDFSVALHQVTFRLIDGDFIAGQTIDPISIANRLPKESEDSGDASRYVLALIEATPSAANVAVYADLVQHQSLLRTAQAAAAEAAKLAGEGASLQDIQALAQSIQELGQMQNGSQVLSMTAATKRLYAGLEQRADNGSGVTGLPTGYRGLDYFTGGLQPGNLIILAARAGMGKSAMALNLAVATAREAHQRVLFFSLEMGSTELMERVLAAEADVSFSRIRSGKLSDADWSRIAPAASAMKNLSIGIVDSPRLNVADMLRICRIEKPALVVVDHLGLIAATGKHNNRREAVDDISRSLKGLAKDLAVPVLALAQLNRSVMARPNKRPMLSDLRESGSIEQDADIVLFIDRPAYYAANDEDADQAQANLIVAKNRHGRTSTIPLIWEGSRQRFRNLALPDKGEFVPLDDDDLHQEVIAT